jgi:hypothetical protein
MSALDAEEDTDVRLQVGAKSFVLSKHTIPANSLWAHLLEDSQEQTLEFPTTLPLPDKTIEIPAVISDTVLRYIDAADGETLPILDGKVTTGIYVRMVNGEVRRRSLQGCNLERYLPAKYADVVRGLSLTEALILKALSLYLGFRDLEDMATLAFVMLYNCLSRDGQAQALELARGYLPD